MRLLKLLILTVFFFTVMYCSGDKDQDSKDKKVPEQTITKETPKKDIQKPEKELEKEVEPEKLEDIVITTIEGDVSWSLDEKADDDKWKRVRPNQKMIKDAFIKTLSDSTCVLNYGEDSNVLIDSNTIAKITVAVEQQEKKLNINLKNGKIFSTLNKVSGIQSVNVGSRTAVAGVRGTAFAFTYDPVKENSTVSVEKGSVEVSRHITGIDFFDDTLKKEWKKYNKPVIVTKFKKITVGYNDNRKLAKRFKEAISKQNKRELNKIRRMAKINTSWLNHTEIQQLYSMHKKVDPDFRPPRPKRKHKPRVKPYTPSPKKPIDVTKRSNIDIEKFIQNKNKAVDMEKGSTADVEKLGE